MKTSTRWAALMALALGACRTAARDETLLATGHVEAADVRITAKVAGRLVEAPLQEGDRAQTGRLVARLDTTDVDLAIVAATADRDQAAAELRLRRAGSRIEDISQIAAQLDAARADAEGIRRERERMQQLFDEGLGTAKARDDSKAAHESALARVAAAEQALVRARAGSRVEEVQSAAARLASLEARLATLRQQKADATIVSPLDGLVTGRIAEPGELMAPGALICVITNVKSAWLTVYVGEPDLGRIRIGQEVDVVTDSGQSRAGRIQHIASDAEFTPRNAQTRDERVKLVFKVKIALANDDGLYKPGMPAEARIRRGA